jgi:glutamate racemase
VNDLPIGVLAEGAGGAHAARVIRARMPKEDVVALCDHAYAPYAARPGRVVADRAPRMASELAALGMKLLVVASIQATEDALAPIAAAAAVPTLALDATLPVAAVRSRSGRIAAVYAAGTIRERPWLRRNRFQRGVEVVAAPWQGLREAVEAGRLPAAAPALPPDADVVALVCPYASAAATLLVDGVPIVDGLALAAERAQRHLIQLQAYARRRRDGRITTLSSDPARSQLAARDPGPG